MQRPRSRVLRVLRAIVSAAIGMPIAFDRRDDAEPVPRSPRPATVVERGSQTGVRRALPPTPAVAVEPAFAILELDEAELDAPRRRRGRFRVDASSLSASVVAAEILGAPLALRNDSRWDRG